MATSYSSIERTMARFMSRAPGAKRVVKRIYQYAVWLRHRQSEQHFSRYRFTPMGVSAGTETFFGYYDKLPTNSSGTHCLLHRSPHPTSHKPSTSKPIQVVLLDLASGHELLELSTSSYNWQQGARAHWLDDELFIFNDFDSDANRYVARVYSRQSLQQVAVFDFPVQESSGKEFLLAINYQRLAALSPDYGYANLPPLKKNELLDLSRDGIWRVEYNTGQSTLLYSLEQIVNVEWEAAFAGGVHSVNHLMLSPSATNFIFVHRFYLGGRRVDRLMLADASGKGLQVLASFGMVSHCSWVDDTTLLGYLRGPDKDDAYWHVDVSSGTFKKLGGKGLQRFGDGHPHIAGHQFVTDTYPDKSRMQHLLLVDWRTGQYEEIGSFYHSFRYDGSARCDLHPRMSADSQLIFFDSVCCGKRALYKMDLKAGDRYI